MTAASTWTSAELAQIKLAVAAGNTARDLETLTGRSRKAIISAVKRYELGPWLAKPGSKPGDTSHIPDDFAERWHCSNQAALAAHYGRATATISLWVKRLGLVRTADSTAGFNRPMPTDFIHVQNGLTIQELMLRYTVGRDIVRRWLSEAGIKRERFQQPLRLIKPNAYQTAPVDRPHRDASRAGMAAEFLRRFGPVARCDARGRFDPNGFHWRRGSTVLSAAEVIERAERNGWDADAWKRVA